ncbi:MAG TPA: hypothetical protein VNM67_04510 [Thermoanaerobaculia bacterium]|nr:hypothetical protein [Thermoanaerobaculia bacterium]
MRHALLVGSMPFRDEEDCMRRALAELGPYLFSLPDGEVGERTVEFPDGTRACWIIRAVEILYKDRESWRVVKEPVRARNGVPSSYEGLHQMEPLRSPEEVADRLAFGYDAELARYYPIFRRLREEGGWNGLKFQMGVPTGLGLGFVIANPEDRMRYQGAFNAVIAREVNAMLEMAGDDVVIQIEAPPEVYAAYQYPQMMEVISIGSILDLVGRIKPGARIGLHLCLGDLHNLPLMQLNRVQPLVELSNRLVEKWPKDRELVYMHYPFAAGNVPPSTDPSLYQPLVDIRLPESTHFVAGFVHEGLSYDENEGILRSIEEARGGTVDVASSCGIGRRAPEVAEQLLRFTARLAAS